MIVQPFDLRGLLGGTTAGAARPRRDRPGLRRCPIARAGRFRSTDHGIKRHDPNAFVGAVIRLVLRIADPVRPRMAGDRFQLAKGFFS